MEPRESCVYIETQGYGHGVMVGRAWDRREARREQIFDRKGLETVIIVVKPERFILRLFDENITFNLYLICYLG